MNKQNIQTYLDAIEQEREAIARSLEIIKTNREYIEEELAKEKLDLTEPH